ncbi:Ti-type conjugative transfer relaxase TraA [Caulobacter sp. NIBR2454]|uniref:Ti-type conjugative transfer relaxase TraA n=1 Tax=Caulobacter sp. NIBR2454 TaxID=3015996 RepID=UPI0022B71CF4|nr:Ti-type conjugative transfer relaxase TraA [Caulobacter sp. NIBR2454]
MAIYHFSAKVISRANGSSAVAAAAYRAASRLHDERLDRAHDFTNKAGVIHSEVMASENTPDRWLDRATLWNEVEAFEKRKDAQLAREVEFAIPRELDQADGIELARAFVQREFVDKGMVADLNVHWDKAEDGSPKPHAHVMLTMREAGPAGFGQKVREWNAGERLLHWREAWAEHVNERLALRDLDVRIDHRSFKDQGIDLEPQDKIGPAGSRREHRGEQAQRAADHHEIARRNGERIIADPRIALTAITFHQATFTDLDVARFAHSHTDDKAQFDRAMSAVRMSDERVALGRDGKGQERFTTREMIAIEQRLEQAGDSLAEHRRHSVGPMAQGDAIINARARGLDLGDEQRTAFDYVVEGRDLAVVVGYAGGGKSAMLGVAREAWEAEGYTVRGAALSGIAAENLEGGSGIPSRTLASLEYAWNRGRETLTNRDVLVIDEAGLVGTRQLERVIGAADRAGAKVVLVGDVEQLQAIEAGAAFRALAERHGAVEISQIRRQREDWQRAATRALATERTAEALDAYSQAGMVHAHETQDLARKAVVEEWARIRRDLPEASQIMLSYKRADVRALNDLARERLKAGGELREERTYKTERGDRPMAPGERLMFLRNERSLGVKNGTLGTLERATSSAMEVRLDDGRKVRFDLKDYNALEHGYAATIHKTQGVTVDRTHILASNVFDRHASYVALSRHRDGLSLHWARDQFSSESHLAGIMGRERLKDRALDYPNAREAPASERGRFEGFTPTAKTRPALEPDDGAHRAVTAFARAWRDAERMREAGLPVLPHQAKAFEAASERIDQFRERGSERLAVAFSAEPELAASAERGRTAAAMAALERPGMPERDPGLERGHERDRGWER